MSIDLGYHAGEAARCSLVIYKGLRPGLAGRSRRNLCQGSQMPPILTAEDVVKRIAAECAFVDDRGGLPGKEISKPLG
jgi:hypothetical protein